MLSPKSNEKELFQVVVHHNQFTVSARRVHQLLAPQQRYESWLQIAILQNALEEGTDYWQRQRMHDNPRRKSHSIVLGLYAIKKLCVSEAGEEQEAQAKQLFDAVSQVQQQMVQACMQYISSYMVYHVRWKPLDGQRIYGLKAVMRSLGMVPAATEMPLRQQYPQHFISYKGKPYLSYGLAQLLHLQRWLRQTEKEVARQQPFAGITAIQ